MSFHPAYPVAGLKPAAYNPRAISEDALDRLQDSIRRLGFAKPIIVAEDGTIVAGHQRTKAAVAMGLLTVPAWVVGSLSTADEVRFNQLHNGTDLDDTDTVVTVPPGPPGCFTLERDIGGDTKSMGAAIRAEVCRLLLLYGNWGGAVATEAGVVVSGQQYALACKLLQIEARVYRIPEADRPAATAAFGQQYGAFSYDHLPRASFIQSFAQPFRLREGEKGNRMESQLYTRHVYPWLAKHQGARVLDFGCGQGDYARATRKAGANLVAYEPFFRRGHAVDTRAVHRMVEEVAAALHSGGRFDAVICEAVVNSVDSRQAEEDVLRSVTALVKPGGMVFLSGRRRERIEKQLTARISAERQAGHRRYVEFLDQEGFSALYRGGNTFGAGGAWFFQKFHSAAQVAALVRRYITEGPYAHTTNAPCWQVAAPQTVAVDPALAEESLAREFDLPWPNGARIGRAQVMVEAYRSAVALG